MILTKKKKQFGLNAASGLVAQLVFAVVGFVLMPYSINRLGEQGFGVYQIARSALVFFMFLQIGMGPTLVRFCSQAIAKNDLELIKKISSAAQLLLGSLGLFAMVLCLIMIPFFISFYEVPVELVRETHGMLLCMALSLFLNMVFIVPQGLVLGANRYDIVAFVDISSHLFRLALIVTLFELFTPSVFFVGVAVMVIALLRFVAVFWFSFKRFGRAVFFSMRVVNLEALRPIMGFSLLNLANAVAGAVAFHGPLLIIGKVLGEEMVTAFAPAMLIGTAVQGFLGKIVRPLVPQASRNVASNNGESLGRWAILFGKMLAFSGFAAVLPLAIFGPELISLWLGNELAWTWPVIAVVVASIALSQVQAANYFLALGGGEITPTVYSQILVALVVFLGIFLGTVWLDWGLMSIALFWGLCFFVRNTLYLSYAYSHQFSYKYSNYLKQVYLIPALIATICISVGWGLKFFVAPLDILTLVAEIAGVLIIYLLLSWSLLLPKDYRVMVLSRVFRKQL